MVDFFAFDPTILIWTVFGSLTLILTIIAIVALASNLAQYGSKGILFLLLILFVPFIGSVFFLILHRKVKRARTNMH